MQADRAARFRGRWSRPPDFRLLEPGEGRSRPDQKDVCLRPRRCPEGMDDHGRRGHRYRAGTPGLTRRGAASGPGGKAVLKLRENDASGKVEFWVYDDGTKPENAKALGVGPRWGLVQNDGKVLAVGILYASYLGGAEGYTATACDGKRLVRPAVLAGREPRAGRLAQVDVRLRRRGRPADPPQRRGASTAVDSGKTGLKGFSAIAVWGDSGKGQRANRLGGRPVGHAGRPGEARCPPARPIRTTRRPSPPTRPIVRPSLYTKDNAPADAAARGPAAEGRASPSTASPGPSTSRPASGQFINGDWYVVGPVTVKAIDPQAALRQRDPEARTGPHGQGTSRRASGSATASCSIRPPR